MQVGNLVRSIHTGEMWVITAIVHGGYVEVSAQWLVPSDHLEVLNG